MTVRARRPTPIADPTMRPTADPLESDSSNKADVPSPSSIPISWVQNHILATSSNTTFSKISIADIERYLPPYILQISKVWIEQLDPGVNVEIPH